MRNLRPVILICLSLLAGVSCLAASTISKPIFGLAVKVSTGGPGADLLCRFNERTGLRLGFDRLGLNAAFNFDEEAVTYAADLKLKTGDIALLFDYYLAKKVFLTAGAGWNLLSADISGKAAGPLRFGDILIPVERIGTFGFLVRPSWRISPYFGIGFGNTLNCDKRLGFAFELGGFYQGPPDITIRSNGLLSPTSNPDHRQAEKLENQISQYSIYPVMKFSVSFRITSVK